MRFGAERDVFAGDIEGGWRSDCGDRAGEGVRLIGLREAGERTNERENGRRNERPVHGWKGTGWKGEVGRESWQWEITEGSIRAH